MLRSLLALSLVAAAALATPVSAQDWAAEIYGGGTFERSETRDGTSFSLDAGTAYGLGFYEQSLVPGVELGFDLMHSDADYTASDTGVESFSLMLNARVPFEIAPGTTAYVGAGLGAIEVDYGGGTTAPALSGDDTVPGGQLGLGIRYDFPAFTAFGELKHQKAFEDADIQGVDQSYEGTSAVVGLRFAF